MKSVLPTQLQQLDARVRELEAAFDIQEKRIAEMQAELDALPQARKRRRSLRTLLGHQLSGTGNGRSRA
jgi:septal ring factor EnvC (AmiA/AmiB activator)